MTLGVANGVDDTSPLIDVASSGRDRCRALLDGSGIGLADVVRALDSEPNLEWLISSLCGTLAR